MSYSNSYEAVRGEQTYQDISKGLKHDEGLVVGIAVQNQRTTSMMQLAPRTHSLASLIIGRPHPGYVPPRPYDSTTRTSLTHTDPLPTHLPSLCRELKIGSFHDCVHRTGLLAEPAVDALSHIDVVTVEGEGVRFTG